VSRGLLPRAGKETSMLSARTVAALLLIGRIGLLGAQETRRLGSGRGHTLGGHVFQPSSAFPDPFVASYLTSNLGAGFATNFQVPVYNAEDSVVGTLKGDLGVAGMGVEYQLGVLRWLGVRVNASGYTRFGTQTPTLLSEGVSTRYGFGAGATARIWGTEKLYLSGAIDYSSDYLAGVEPLEYVEAVAQTIGKVLDSLVAVGGITLNPAVIDSVIRSLDLTGYSLHHRSTAQKASVGVRAAYAPVRWLGFTGLLQTGLVGTFTGSSNVGLLDVGAAADVDFDALWHIPVGVKVSGRWQSVNEAASDVAKSTTDLGASIAYTGRGDFSLGLELLISSLAQRRSDATLAVQRYALSMRYYF
jgi:hypothetical protein